MDDRKGDRCRWIEHEGIRILFTLAWIKERNEKS
jgi:hypothetical protein